MRSPVVVLNSLGHSIKVPLLRSIVVSLSLHPNIVSTMALSNSSKWKFGNKVEWSVYMEAPSFVKSLGLWALSLVKIEDSPFLVSTSVVSIYTNFRSLFILSTIDIKNLAVLPVDELFILILEHLEPS
jgi:hypothetical protein